jgi:hypothetical protein
MKININKPREDSMIFTFGSNMSGFHGAGAARIAELHYGAKRGVGEGLVGQSYAIPTKNHRIETLSLPVIKIAIDKFVSFAKKNSKLQFKVTQIGCGLAGYSPEDIAPLFAEASSNCFFDTKWKPFLGEEKNYWGTFE